MKILRIIPFLLVAALAYPQRIIFRQTEIKPLQRSSPPSGCSLSLSAAPGSIQFTQNTPTTAAANSPLSVTVSWNNCAGSNVYGYAWLPSSNAAFNGPTPLTASFLFASINGGPFQSCTVYAGSLIPAGIWGLLGSPEQSVYCGNSSGLILQTSASSSGSASSSIAFEMQPIEELPAGVYQSTLSVEAVIE